MSNLYYSMQDLDYQQPHRLYRVSPEIVDLSSASLIHYDSTLDILVLSQLPSGTIHKDRHQRFIFQSTSPRLQRLSHLWLTLQPIKQSYQFDYKDPFKIATLRAPLANPLDPDALILTLKIIGVSYTKPSTRKRAVKGFGRVIDDNNYFSAIPLVNELTHWDNGILTTSNHQITTTIYPSPFVYEEKKEEETPPPVKQCPDMVVFYYSQYYSEPGTFFDDRVFLVDKRYLVNPVDSNSEHKETLTDNNFNLLIGGTGLTGELDNYIYPIFDYLPDGTEYPKEYGKMVIKTKPELIHSLMGNTNGNELSDDMIECFNIKKEIISGDVFHVYYLLDINGEETPLDGIILYEPFSTAPAPQPPKITVIRSTPEKPFGLSLSLKQSNLFNSPPHLKMVDKEGHECQ